MLNSLAKKISRAQAEIPYRLELMRQSRNLPALNPQDQQMLAACRRDGAYITTLTDLGLASTPQMLESANRRLQKLRTAFPQGYTKPQADQSTESASRYPHAWTVTHCPEFAVWAHEPRLSGIIQNYIGLPVAFQGVQLQRDFPNKKQILAELWHTDAEDRRMLKAIVYLTDVGPEHGPFQYIPKSKVSPSAWRKIKSQIARSSQLGISDTEMAQIIPRSDWKSCTGPAGTVVFVDTKAVLHHGKSRTQERAALFFVYTSQQPLHPEYCTVFHDDSFTEPGFVIPNT